MYIMSLVDNDFSYTWFFYLGIVLFFIHIALYGLELHISYFSLILIYILDIGAHFCRIGSSIYCGFSSPWIFI